MALARARDTIALASWLEQAILGGGGEGTWRSLHRRELWTSAGPPSSFHTLGNPITQTSAERTSLCPFVKTATPANGTPARTGRENSSIASEYSSVTLGHERPDEFGNADDFELGSDSSLLNAYEATLGIGAIHLPIGNPPEEDPGDGNVELYHAKVAAMIVELTIEEEQKRLYASKKEEPT